MRALICAIIFLASMKLAEAGSISGKVKCKGAVSECDTVIYAERTPKTELPVPRPPAVLDQTDLTFVPRVLPIVVGTTVMFPNHDDVPHNVYSSSPAKIFNMGIYPKGASRQITFDRPGEVLLLCNIHPHMSAYVLVLEQPYFSIATRDGSFSLKELPPGKYKITTWHARYKPVLRSVEIKGADNVPVNFELREPR